MTAHSNAEAGVPVLTPESIMLRLLAWMLSTITMTVASAVFDALAFSDMLASSALLALVCAMPFQRDAAVELALRQLAHHSTPGSGSESSAVPAVIE